MSLFNRNDKEQVPEVEVQGEEVVINHSDRTPDGKPNEPQARLPKTKWF